MEDSVAGKTKVNAVASLKNGLAASANGRMGDIFGNSTVLLTYKNVYFRHVLILSSVIDKPRKNAFSFYVGDNKRRRVIRKADRG